MLGRNRSEPALFQMVELEALVPPDHRLRKIDAVLDLGFVHEAVAECYSQSRGRPSIDPELALRMMLLGVLYDLSDRELCQEISMHVGMRWFCRLNLHDPVPDHSTLSKLRNERWAESGLFDRLFTEVVRQCGEAGLTSGRHLSVDGTQIKANASVKSLRRIKPKDPDDPPAAAGGGGGREPQGAGAWSTHGVKYSNQTHRSSSDPEALLYRKADQEKARLSYLVNDLIDTKSRVILRRVTSPATGHAERETALEMLDEVVQSREELALPKVVEILTADAGYGSAEFAADVLERGVIPHIPLLSDPVEVPRESYQRRTFDLDRARRRKETIRRSKACHLVSSLYGTPGYQVSRKLRIRSEHLFAEAKNEHGLGQARSRGLLRVQVQMSLVGVVQNLKRLVNHVSRKQRGPAGAALRPPRAAHCLDFRPSWISLAHIWAPIRLACFY
jgi:IS5 family transposase